MAEWSSPETAERIYAHLVERADEHREVVTSARVLATELHISRGAARNGIRRLLDTDAMALVRLGTGHLYPSRFRVRRDVDQAVLRVAAPIRAA